MQNARQRKRLGCYSERHHITPRSLGGADEARNLVLLTFREHFLAHWLLTKMTTDEALRRMQRALFAMSLRTGSRDVQPWQFLIARSAIVNLERDPEQDAIWAAASRMAEAERFRRRKSRYLARNGERSQSRKQSLAEAETLIQLRPNLSRRDLSRLANGILNPRRSTGL